MNVETLAKIKNIFHKLLNNSKTTYIFQKTPLVMFNVHIINFHSMYELKLWVIKQKLECGHADGNTTL